MDNSRRSFLGVLTASVATALSFRGIGTAQKRSSRMLDSATGVSAEGDSLAQLGWNSFYGQLNTDFEFSPRGVGRMRRAPKLRLTAIKNTDLREGEVQAGDPQCFVLTFTSRSSQLSQDTYTVNHAVLGQFELFISEASTVDGEYNYTAVINRLVG